MSYQYFDQGPSFQRDLHSSVERQSSALGLAREMARRKATVAADTARRNLAALGDWESEGGAIVSSPIEPPKNVPLHSHAGRRLTAYAVLAFTALITYRFLLTR